MKIAARVLLFPIGIVLWSGCDAQPQGLPPAGDAGVLTGVGPYCDVMRAVFLPSCAGCHHPGGAAPDLSYEGGKTSIIGQASTVHLGKTFVVPGDPAASFVYEKVLPNLPPGFGVRMPVGSDLSIEAVMALEAWIRGGASLACDQMPIGIDGGTQAHPDGFEAASVHGTEMKQQTQDCRTCHGADLTGGIGPSCDGCHQAEWRTTCTYCHGGTDDTSGAPPRDLSGVTATDQLTFRAHTAHAANDKHPAYDCTMCHDKPEDVLSMGHAFDEEPKTPGHADMDFTGGYSPAGQYAGNGACTNLYCHGSGRANGDYDHTMPAPACGSCHPVEGSTTDDWRRLSGRHRTHLVNNVGCQDCHGETVGSADQLTTPDLHVDGVKQITITAAGFTRGTDGRCTGICHTERHVVEAW